MSKQTWECPVCGWRYTSPIRVSEAQCKQRHLPAKGQPDRGQMILVEGSSIETKRKQASSGNKQVRRA